MIMRTLNGEPVLVGDREIVPVVTISGFARTRRAVAAGLGGGVLRAAPLAVIERRGGGERRIPIRDATGQALRSIVAAGIALWVVLWMVRRRWNE